ncbi:hypothetical protein [Streptococcus constellatus]|uniref:hypothetical protein n=1 Tax=Streptococcus constellatus TaxID=76860 RepID=UPI002001CB02|nr:hypothetical protein [Streptococcus constellatus]
MNKRIKKKKAKQAELLRLKQIEEAIAYFKENPIDIHKIIRDISNALHKAFTEIAAAFSTLDKQFENWRLESDEENSSQDKT